MKSLRDDGEITDSVTYYISKDMLPIYAMEKEG